VNYLLADEVVQRVPHFTIQLFIPVALLSRGHYRAPEFRSGRNRLAPATESKEEHTNGLP
jgi:hypothetical protein